VEQIEDRLFFARRIVVYLGTRNPTEKENLRSRLLAQYDPPTQPMTTVVLRAQTLAQVERQVRPKQQEDKLYAKQDVRPSVVEQNTPKVSAKASVVSRAQTSVQVKRQAGFNQREDKLHAQPDVRSPVMAQNTPKVPAKAPVVSHSQAVDQFEHRSSKPEAKLYAAAQTTTRKAQPAQAELQLAKFMETGQETRRRQCEELRDKPREFWPSYCFTGNY
jgi:hypothetical protein